MDATDVRAFNTALLLKLIWESKGVSRAELARISGLARSTVSDIVSGLLLRGLIEESHLARSTGGRPPIVLRFRDSRFRFIGVEMGASHLSALTADVHGKALTVFHSTHDVQDDPHGALRVLMRLVARCIHASEPAEVVGIGVAVPCPIDPAHPDRLSARILPRWADISLAERLQDRFPLPVFIDNDANLGALAERWWGAGRGVGDFAYVKVATGVGAGLIVDGEIYRGSGGIAGEIGHTAIEASGPPCRCGLNGCLEAMIGTQSLLRQLHQQLPQHPTSSLAAIATPQLSDLIQAAREGDALACRLIHNAGNALGVAFANLLNIFNPSCIILGGSLSRVGDVFLSPIKKTILRRALWDSTTNAEVLISPLGEEAIAIGAATQVLSAALARPSLFPPMEST